MADIFLHLDGVNGGSTDRDHEDWIEVHSVSWGVDATTAASPSRGAASVTGKARQLPLALTAPTSIASPLLFAAVTETTRFRAAMIDVRRAGRERSQSVVRWNLRELTLNRLEIEASADGVVDSFVLLTQRVELTAYRWADDGGTTDILSREWDFTSHGVRVTPPNG